MYIVTSVRDRKTEEFRLLYISRTSEAAKRMFADALLTGEDTVIRQHPDDFYLAQVGYFDEDTGELSGMNDAELHRNLLEAAHVFNTAARNAKRNLALGDQLDIEAQIPTPDWLDQPDTTGEKD